MSADRPDDVPADPLAAVPPHMPWNTDQKVSQLNRAALITIVLTGLMATVSAGVPAWIARSSAEPVACVQVVEEFRRDLSGNPQRLADYLDPGADGQTVLSRDRRAKECGIDEEDLKRYAAQNMVNPPSEQATEGGLP